MDVLSDTLRVVRLTGALFFTATYAAPWSFQSPPSDDIERYFQAQPGCVTLFHMVVRGRCWITVAGQHAFQVEAGDVVILPHAAAHRMGSHLDALPEADVTSKVVHVIQSARPDEGIPQFNYGSEQELMHVVCGYLHCDQRFNPLIESLPTVLLVRVGQHAGSEEAASRGALPAWCVLTAEAGDWLDTTRQYTIEEAASGRPGSAAMLPRLIELLFVEVVRRYMQQLPAEDTGWLAGVRDPDVGCVLRLVHAHPERSWTVAELARAAALSRSALARRFTALIGEPPIQYLLGWRMQLAQSLLGQSNLSISEIAERVGYESEAAFNRAFKRYVGQPPATWRRQGV
jgi:AraC-like DNA-binding protein